MIHTKKNLAMLLTGAIYLLSAGAGTATSSGGGLATAAYEQRMSGHLGDAKQILEEGLAQNPADALAIFELSRLKCHMMLGGNPRLFESTLAEVQTSIDRAVELEPDNVCFAYYAGLVGAMQSFVAMNLGEPSTREKHSRACDAFATAVRLEPGYHEAKLYLVELYGVYPPEAGGDLTRAEEYMAELAKVDEIYGLKARSILEDVGITEWQLLREKHPGNTDVLEELGKAYLRGGDEAAAVQCFEEAVALDPNEASLYLDLGRHHFGLVMEIMRMRDEEQNEELQAHLAAAEAAYLKFLDEDPPTPMKAYALRMLSNVMQGAGDEERRNRYKEQAKKLDPHHSRATARPGPALFTPPGVIVHEHVYLTRPY